MFLSCICFTSVQRLLISAYLHIEIDASLRLAELESGDLNLCVQGFPNLDTFLCFLNFFLILLTSPPAHAVPWFSKLTSEKQQSLLLTTSFTITKIYTTVHPHGGLPTDGSKGQRMSLCLRRANLGKLTAGEAVCGEICLVPSCEQGTHSKTHRKVT